VQARLNRAVSSACPDGARNISPRNVLAAEFMVDALGEEKLGGLARFVRESIARRVFRNLVSAVTRRELRNAGLIYWHQGDHRRLCQRTALLTEVRTLMPEPRAGIGGL
jgi:hypothetical protein